MAHIRTRLAMVLTVLLVALGAPASTMVSSAPAMATTAAAAPAQAQRTNILAIKMDDMRADELRFMPHVRRLIGDQGTTFNRAFSTNALCCPAIANVQTGQYSHNNGIWGNDSTTRGGYYRFRDRGNPGNTLPVWMQRNGYKTGSTGKFMNRYGERNPREMPPGYDQWYVPPGLQAYTFYNQVVNHNGDLFRFKGHATTLVKKFTGVMMRDFGSKPWFVQSNYLAPHGQWREGKGWSDPVPLEKDRNAPVSPLKLVREGDYSDKPYFVRRLPALSGSKIAEIQRRHKARVRSLMGVDRAIRANIAQLRKSGELDNTLIIFYSDNGYQMGEHKIPDGKTFQYEESTRIPLLMRGPGVPKGKVVSAQVNLQDITRTILDASDTDAGRVQDGISLLKVAQNPKDYANRPMLYEISNRLGHGSVTLATSRYGTSFYRAIRVPGWVFIRHITGDRELYNLVRDPRQFNNLAGKPSVKKIQRQLAERLDKLQRCDGEECNRPFTFN